MYFLISLYWGGGCQTHPHHFSKLFYFKNIKLYNAKSVRTKKAQKINSEVNERPLKNIGTHR